MGVLEGYSGVDVEYPVILRRLLASCYVSTESVLILIASLKLWDAEMVLRSVIEGSLKFVYLCVGEETEIKKKFDEYQNHLPEINRLKRHQRLATLLSAVSDRENNEWKPFRDLLLSEREKMELETRYPRNVRKQIEQKWSFHSIINSFHQAGIEELDRFKHLFYGYGQGSHVLHQDSDGINMIWEREQRDDNRRFAIEIAHGAREMSDLLIMAFLRYLAILRLCSKDTLPAKVFYEKQQPLFDQFHDAQACWYNIEYPDDLPTA